MRALWLVRCVDGKQLVPEEVRAGLQALRDRRRPRVVVRDELALSPGARIIVTTNQTRLINLELHQSHALVIFDEVMHLINHTQLSVEESTLVQVVPGQAAIYVITGPIVCGQALE